jgi:hypothetical protein
MDSKNQQQQSSYQKTTGWQSYIVFSSDKESKLLSFTGKFDKQDEQAKDFETGQVIPGKYVARYSFENYDIQAQTIHLNFRSGSVAKRKPVQCYITFKRTRLS